MFRDMLVALSAGETHFAAETAGHTLAGAPIHCWVQMAIAPGHEPTWGNVFLSVLDITERKQAVAELQHMNDTLERRVQTRTAELEQLNAELQRVTESKDTFVSSVSHELRTPIASLKLRQHLLARQPARAEEHLTVMQRETERLENIIEDLLYLSRLDQGYQEFSPRPLDLNGLVEEYARDRGLLAEQAGLHLITHLHPDLPTVQADRGLLGQALSVLLTNAINYTPAGGQITLGTHCCQSEHGQGVELRISDTGLGIPPEEQALLFERFYRGEVGRTSGKAGTGLGLSIVQSIARRHGGYVAVCSSGVPGEGAIFSVWLPITDSEPRNA
ncbi:MAG: HAMP domain-containing histidine kinase, partial [Anaerolineae bacterium]|nr:HAMP domain-containing histidine kinase [Anaerolineae bacterium]